VGTRPSASENMFLEIINKEKSGKKHRERSER
jgi:hypothetical protein